MRNAHIDTRHESSRLNTPEFGNGLQAEKVVREAS